MGRLRMLLVCGLVLASASPALAMNCVQYVRQVSGMNVSGDGWQWWGNSAGRFEHGHAPKENAILVFDRTREMEHGHVAVVSRVMGPRLITVNHANWTHARSLKGHVETGIMVQDVSDRNDWSQVRVMAEGSGSFGRVNPILGFVYNTPGHFPVNDPSLLAENDGKAALKDIDNE